MDHKKSPLKSSLNGEIVQEYCLDTTMHGFKDLIKSGPLRRVLWSILLVSMVVLMVYQAQTQFRLFVSRPVSTNMALNYPKELPFPAVLICNTNHYRYTYLVEYEPYIQDYRISYVRDHNLFTLLQQTHTRIPRNDIIWENLTSNMDSLPHSTDSQRFLIDAAHQLEDMLIDCNLPDGKPCTTKDFSIFVTDYGVCYSWNNNITNPLIVQKGGAETDLYMLLNIGAYERTPGVARTIGLKILIFDQKTFPSISETAIDVSPGYQFSIPFQRVEKYRVGPKDGGTCVYSMPLVHFGDGPYSYDMCQQDKVIEMIIKECGCLPYNAPHYEQIQATISNKKSTIGFPPPCTVKQHMMCVVRNRGQTTQHHECLQSCDTVTLKSSISFAKNPTELGYKSMSPERAVLFTNQYNRAIEALQRLDPDAVKKTQDEIDKLYRLRDWLKQNHLEPKFETFQSSHDRLKKLNCYSNISSNTGFLYASLQSAKVGADSDLSILRILHPEIPLKYLIANRKSYLEHYSGQLYQTRIEVLGLLKKLKLLTGFFHSDSFAKEMTLDIEEYRITFEEILPDYENESTTKMRFADEISILQNLKAGITASIIDPMNRNIIVNLLWYVQQSNYSTEVEELKKTLSQAINSELLMQILLPLADRPDQCVKEVKATADSLQHTGYNMDFITNSICPPEIDVESFTEIIGEMESCLFGDVKNAVVELSDVIRQIKPSLAQAFSGITLYLQNFAIDMGPTNSNFEDNFLALNIYYADLSVEQEIQSRSYSFWSFLCDIGGTLGLFLGASIITIYELIDFFILKPLFRYVKFGNQIKSTK